VTTTPTTTRLPQLGQAVERLLDAIATSPDYQRTGSVTYQSTPKSGGRWQAGQHRCGPGAITTAESNGLIRIEAAGPTSKTLALTEEGRRHVRSRDMRRLITVLEGEVTTLAAIAATPDEYRCKPVTFEARVIALVEKPSAKNNAVWGFLTVEDEGVAADAWLLPRHYQRLKGKFDVGDRVRISGSIRHKGSGRLVAAVRGFRKAGCVA
jgi:hypothetical protein